MTARCKDRFLIMAYRCDGCGAEERIWNSRDGVTPYVVGCRACGGDARHVRWGEDVYAPDHTPSSGDRIFIDLHPEKALQRRIKYVEEWWEHPRMPMRDHPFLGPLGKEGAAAELARADVDSFAPHTPDLIEVDEGVLAWLRRSTVAGGAS